MPVLKVVILAIVQGLAELLPVRERVLGPGHPDTLNTRHELATWTGSAGDPAAARDQDAGLLPARERVLDLLRVRRRLRLELERRDR